MAEYRAKKKTEPSAPNIAPRRGEVEIRGETSPKTGLRVSTNSNYRYLPGDKWVGELTQAQRDYLLNQPSMMTPKRSRND